VIWARRIGPEVPTETQCLVQSESDKVLALRIIALVWPDLLRKTSNSYMWQPGFRRSSVFSGSDDSGQVVGQPEVGRKRACGRTIGNSLEADFSFRAFRVRSKD